MSQLGITLPDRYRLEGPVASGGMAAVYAAHDTLLDRPVAVKVLAEHLNEDVAARERFQREARAAARISSHPGVVTIFDVGEHQGRSFIVMELFRGGTLADVLRSDERPPHQQSLRWLERAAEALDAAHAQGIVHRDIKPANLLLDEQGNLAVADFGIARLAWEEAVTQTGQVLGTAAYLSPEQAEGGTATEASDRYALACVAYELVTGARPFDGEHFAAQARAHIEDEPTPATQRDPSLPREVDRVFARGLAKDPGERWPSAIAFVDALRTALGGGRFQTPAPRTASTVAMPPRPPRRNVLPLVLAGGLLLAAILAIVLAASSGNDEPRQRAESTPTEEPRQEATAEPEAQQEEPAEEPTQEPQQPQEQPEAAPSGSPSQLNDQGYALYQQGDYAGAIPYFQNAVDGCGDSTELVCAYALYNLGSSLHRAGKSAEAIPLLQRRLDGWNNQRGVVKKELKAACKAAGEKC